MKISMVMCKPATPPTTLDIPPAVLTFGTSRQQQKVVVVMGATGTGKSRLSIDLAKKFPAEIINSDKIQAHQGLDIVTNKIRDEERCNIPHHLLGVVHPDADFTAANFSQMASLSVESILSRDKLPIIVGGSNSYIEALIDSEFRTTYKCLFLWVDVALPVLHQFVKERVDKMVENGMVDEVRDFFDFNADYKRGIRKAIGVVELDAYFRAEPFLGQENRDRLLQAALLDIKTNTFKLACRQVEKIYRLKNLKRWNIHRLDATGAFLQHGKAADEAWEELVAGPSRNIVEQFVCTSRGGRRSFHTG